MSKKARTGTKTAQQVAQARDKQAKKQHERQQEAKKEQGALRDAFNQNGNMSEAFIEQMISSEEFEPGAGQVLQTRTVAKIQNLLSRDVVLGNLTTAQENDVRYKLEVLKMKVIGIHPPKEGITGKERAFLLDDASEEVQPLTQQERILLDDFFEALKIRLTRGREGFEREQMNTNISRAETDDQGSQESSGGWGLFS